VIGIAGQNAYMSVDNGVEKNIDPVLTMRLAVILAWLLPPLLASSQSAWEYVQQPFASDCVRPRDFFGRHAMSQAK